MAIHITYREPFGHFPEEFLSAAMTKVTSLKSEPF